MSSQAIDTIRLEVLKNALLAITDEMAAALQRSAYSTNVKTRGDFSCALFDANVRLVAQSFSQPTHLGSLVHSTPRAIAEFGAARLENGDGILMNDPHRGAVHLNDISLISPVDLDGQRIGYVANVAHHVDVGGSTPGSLGLNSETYQEGLKIAPADHELLEGIQRVSAQMYAQQHGEGDKDAQARALSDPEIQRILADPLIQQVLKEMRENPAAAQGYLRDERIAAALNKLITAGVIRTR